MKRITRREAIAKRKVEEERRKQEMTKTINWQSMTTKEKNVFVAEHVMGYEIHAEFVVGSEIELDYALCVNTKEGIVDYERIPDYLGDMNVTLLVMMHLGEKEGMYIQFGYSPASFRYPPSIPHYFCKIIIDFYPEIKYVRAYGKTVQDAICVAALRAKGFQVVNAFESLPVWKLTLEDGEDETYRTREEAEKAYSDRVKMLKQRLRWAVDVRKLKIEETKVPEDYFNGIEWA